MKVSREAAAETRRRIVEVAGQLFRAKGFEGIGVADIMKQAGLTHGGFYGHFGSKSDLAAAACAQSGPDKTAIWEPRDVAPGSTRLAAFVAAYLSPAHRDNPADGCVLAALGSDVGREPLPVRDAFTGSLRRRLEQLSALVPGRSPAARRRKALATLAGVVGALTLARAVADPDLSNELLAVATETFGS